MRQFNVDQHIAKALAAPKPKLCLQALWRQLGISIGDGEVPDPIRSCRKLAFVELRLYTEGDDE